MHEKIISLHALYPSKDGMPKDKVDRSHDPHKELCLLVLMVLLKISYVVAVFG